MRSALTMIVLVGIALLASCTDDLTGIRVTNENCDPGTAPPSPR